MKNLKTILIILLALLCWNCSCDNPNTGDVPVNKLDHEIQSLHSEQKIPVPPSSQSDYKENVNIPKVQNYEQNLNAKDSTVKKKRFVPDIRSFKYSEQVRKMRRRNLIRNISSNAIQIDQNINHSISTNKEPLASQAITDNLLKVEDLSQKNLPSQSPETHGSQKESTDEVNMPGQHPNSDAMPSFDEWKKMMLAEQEKSGEKVPSLNVPGKKIASQKRLRNYASYECGAKLVASNAEAEGTSRILNEQVDEYMLNPCKAKAWFVIELCETVQVTQIELANFELFSSCPKDFAVSLSDNFPTRDWVSVGVFTAAEQRVLQSFQLKSEGYRKFIKVELLSHYGKEHYCPLNVVRVFGTSMVDEYEEMEKMSDQHLVLDDELDRLDIPVEDKSSTNIFGSATDAVYNIVKKAAQVLGQHQPLEENAEKGIEQNVSDSQHCPVIDDSCSAEANKTIPDSSTSNSMVLSNMVHSSLYQHLRHCDECISSSHLSHSSIALPQCRFFQVAFGPVVYKNICDWFKYHYLLPLEDKSVSDFGQQNDSHIEKQDSASSTVFSVIIDRKSQAIPSYSDVMPSASPKFAQETNELPLNSKSVNTDLINRVLKPSIQPTKTVQSSNKDDSLIVLDSVVNTELPLESSSSKMHLKSDEDKLLSSTNKFIVKTDDTSAVASSLSDASSVTLNFSKEAEEKLDAYLDEKIDLETIEVPAGELSDAKTNEAGESSTAKIDPVVTGSVSFSASQKESVFVRMNNRIKALELNMSLSSQYLQELSQRYRRQMEEMQRAFNKTIGTLNDTAKKAAERDLKQQEIIGNLQSQLSNLTNTVDQMMQKHMFLMAVEAIIMITVMSLCVRRISSSIPAVTVTSTSISSTGPRSSRSDIKRRNSSGSCSPSNIKRVKKRCLSDESLHLEEPFIVEPYDPVIVGPRVKIKKRNRKKKQMKRSSSNPTTSPRKCPSSSQKKHIPPSCTAGILFTNIKSDDHICENCNQLNTKLCDLGQCRSVEKRTNSIPLKNLTNGATDLNLQTDITKGGKFTFRKYWKFQKRESI